MTIAAEIETTIGRSADDVFRQLVAVERYPEWLVDSGIVRVERLEPGPLAPGSRLRIEQRMAGRASALDGVVTALEPARLFAFAASDRDGLSIEAEAALAPDGPFSRLRFSIRLRLPLRYRFFESAIAPRARTAAGADIDRFRRILESVAG